MRRFDSENNEHRHEGDAAQKPSNREDSTGDNYAYKAYTRDKRPRINRPADASESSGTSSFRRPSSSNSTDRDSRPKNFGDKRPYSSQSNHGDKPSYAGREGGYRRYDNRGDNRGDNSGENNCRRYDNREGGYRKPEDDAERGNRRSFNPNFNADGRRYDSAPKPYAGSRNQGGERDFRKPYGEHKPYGERKPYGEHKPYGERKPYGQSGFDSNNTDTTQGDGNSRERFDSPRPYGSKPYGAKPYGAKRTGDGASRSYSPKPYGAKRSFDGAPKPYGKRSDSNDKPYGQRKPYTDRAPKADSDKTYKRVRSTPTSEYPTFPATHSGEIRLNRYVSMSGICSRREADAFITAGVVSVNGVVVTELGTKVLPTDEVRFNDEPIKNEKKVYILMNKPKGYVTSMEDPHADKLVMDLVADACKERIYPVGRLDKSSVGVLLLTNDGDLAKQLTHPSSMKKKIYQVSLDRQLTEADMQQIADGITLEDGQIYADQIAYVDENKKEIGIEIHSGRNRIVRRIFDHLGYNVVKLDRVYFAGLTKKKLRRGGWRFLSSQEVSMLKSGNYE